MDMDVHAMNQRLKDWRSIPPDKRQAHSDFEKYCRGWDDHDAMRDPRTRTGRYYEGYMAAKRTYEERVAEHAEDDGVVFIHDDRKNHAEPEGAA